MNLVMKAHRHKFITHITNIAYDAYIPYEYLQKESIKCRRNTWGEGLPCPLCNVILCEQAKKAVRYNSADKKV